MSTLRRDPPATQRVPATGRRDDDLAARLQQLTGVTAIRARSPAEMPVGFLLRRSPSPDQIVSNLPVRRRTYNVLRRYLAQAPALGPWTYGRLAHIPGFGLASLVDVLEAQAVGQHALDDGAVSSEFLGAVVERAIALVAHKLPASEEQIRNRFARARLGNRRFGLATLERAARACRRPLPFAVLRREGLAVAVPTATYRLAVTVHTLAVRGVLSYGAVSARVVAFRAGADDLAFVRAIVSARAGFAWLDRKRDWFWYGAPVGPTRPSSAAAERPAWDLPPPPEVVSALAQTRLRRASHRRS